jgi:hypothetical protein
MTAMSSYRDCEKMSIASLIMAEVSSSLVFGLALGVSNEFSVKAFSFFAVFLRHSLRHISAYFPRGLHHVAVWKEQSQLHNYNIPISQ